MRLRSLSQKLINSASEIHSTADVERQIAILRNRRGLDFWQDSSAQNGDQTYEVRIENGLLHRLRVVPPTMLGMTIAIHDGNLRYIIVTMFAGRQPSTTSGVWVQEWFGSDSEPNHSNRKSTRLNSSHANISYAVFCLKKKKK